MKAKHLIILAIVLVSLLVVTLTIKALKPTPPREEKLVDIIEPLITPMTITYCRINFQDKEVIMQKEEGSWVVKNQHDVLVDMEKFENFIAQLDKMEGDPRSAQEDILADYGITDDQGVKVVLRDGDLDIADIIVGVKKSGFDNFVRRSGSNEVYITNSRLLDGMNLFDEVSADNFKEDFWDDKRIVHFDPLDVNSLTLKKNGKDVLKIIAEGDEGPKKWKIDEDYPFIIDPTKVKRYVEALSVTSAAEVVSSEEATGFESSAWQITVAMDDETEINIVLGDKKDGYRYLKVEGVKYCFKMNPDFLRKFDKTDGEFFMNNLFMVNPQTIMNLDIKDSQEGKTYRIIKKALPEEDPDKKYEWLSASGDKFDGKSVLDVLVILKNIVFMTRNEPVSLPKNMITLKITFKDNSSHEYQITRGEKLENGAVYHYLKVKDDNRGYGIKENQIKALQDALRKMEEAKTKE